MLSAQSKNSWPVRQSLSMNVKSGKAGGGRLEIV
jgi:hypothetical protein